MLALICVVASSCGGSEESPPDSQPEPSSPQARKLFVTGTSFSGDVGGLAGADAKCQQAAAAASLAGTFRAWLSDASGQAVARLSHSAAPYVRVDGVQVAANWADLVDGALAYPINVDEHGTIAASEYVWTGTDAHGSVLPDHCSNWTVGGFTPNIMGRVGSTGSASAWSDAGALHNCGSFTHRLYCVQQ
jgi:hypothetical protein